MGASKVMCWEFNKCGSEKNGSCITVVQKAGRSCWLVAGTLNGGKPECKKVSTTGGCKVCGFYSGIKSGNL